MEKQIIDWRIIVSAMVCITGLEVLAMFKGIDGILLTAVVGIIAGLTGYIIKSPIKTQ